MMLLFPNEFFLDKEIWGYVKEQIYFIGVSVTRKKGI